MGRKKRLWSFSLWVAFVPLGFISGCYTSRDTEVEIDRSAQADSGHNTISQTDSDAESEPIERDGHSGSAIEADRSAQDESSDRSQPKNTLPSSGQRDATATDTLPPFETPDFGTWEDSGVGAPLDATLQDAEVTFRGLEPGERAPASGEAPSNDYGEPTEPWGPYDWGFPENCNGGMSIDGFESNPCVAYSTCSISCNRDSDCNNGGSGDAIPNCSIDSTCVLLCDDDTFCPDGMVCVFGFFADDICMWPSDIAKPDCPAWCELDPPPKGCPDRCAVAGVGCDPQEPDYCCEGLFCAPEGWCVELE